MYPARGLTDLDDGCLINILGRLDPLPHLFEVAAVSKAGSYLISDDILVIDLSCVF